MQENMCIMFVAHHHPLPYMLHYTYMYECNDFLFTSSSLKEQFQLLQEHQSKEQEELREELQHQEVQRKEFQRDLPPNRIRQRQFRQRPKRKQEVQFQELRQ
eukprot:72188_1